MTPNVSAVTSMISLTVMVRGLEEPMMSDRTRLGHLAGDLLAVEVAVGRDPGECALELADVVLHMRGDQLEDVVVDEQRLVLDPLQQDREPGFELRWLDVGGETASEPAPQAVLRAWRSSSAACPR